MKILKEISDTGYFPKTYEKQREAARAVLFDENNMVPLLYVSKHKYHKIPGGGIDEGEEIQEALKREIQEETGCKAKINGELGTIIEFRSQWNLKQTSYCYIGNIIEKGEPDFTENELEQGFEITRFTLDEAIEILKNNKPKNYEGKCIQKRDIIFLQEAKNIL